MESKPDGQYCYICHAVDHFSKLHVIFPLVSKEVANEIKVYVFSYVGLPKIIHTHTHTPHTHTHTHTHTHIIMHKHFRDPLPLCDYVIQFVLVFL